MVVIKWTGTGVRKVTVEVESKWGSVLVHKRHSLSRVEVRVRRKN